MPTCRAAGLSLRSPLVLAAAVLAIALLAVASVGAAGAVGASAGAVLPVDAQDNDSAPEATPGERFGGVVGAEQAALDGAVAERTFGVQIADAESDDEAADVVADRLDTVETRLDDVEDRLGDLEQRRQDGELSGGAYAARVAALETDRASLARQLNHTEAAASGLPEDVLADRGVATDAIGTLQERADALGGRAVREVARGIVGPGVGGLGPGEHVPGDVPGVGDVTDRGGPDDPSGRDDGPPGRNGEPSADGSVDDGADTERADETGGNTSSGVDDGDAPP